MTRPASSSGYDSPVLNLTLATDPLLSSHSSQSSGRTTREHSLYDVTPDPDAYDDDKEIDLALAYLQNRSSTAQSSASAPGAPSSASPATLAAKWHAITRRLTRRGLLAALVALAVVVSVSSAAAGGSADGEALDRLRIARERVRQSVAGSWAALKWSRLQAGDEGDLVEELDVLSVLNYNTSRPTLREQLKPGMRYVTAMAYGGHANQMISIQKMLYFAKMTNRVGIIPSLMPIHIDGSPADMSSFYDLRRFWQESHIPAVEFSQVKPLDIEGARPQNEHLACWSVQELLHGFANLETWSFDVHDIWIDHWPLPPLARGLGGFDVAFDALRLFDFDVGAKQRWIERVQRESLPQKPPANASEPFTGDKTTNVKSGFDPAHTAPPDDQVMCFDNTLFLGPVMFPELAITARPLEHTVPGEGLSWINVGQYLHFNERVERLADEYLMRLFDVSSPEKIPPFITIHLRRGDFKEFTGFTALDKYVSALDRVRAALQARLDDPDGWTGPGRAAFRRFGRMRAADYAVVTTTDERGDTPFVQEVRALGWKVLDHDAFETKATLGGWWPTMLDGAILARGRSFVGTHASTFSHLAGLRVKYWRGGLVEVAS
ncbi:hypothetical protein JCM3770_006644 [Rhodotorula araucariae]